MKKSALPMLIVLLIVSILGNYLLFQRSANVSRQQQTHSFDVAYTQLVAMEQIYKRLNTLLDEPENEDVLYNLLYWHGANAEIGGLSYSGIHPAFGENLHMLSRQTETLVHEYTIRQNVRVLNEESLTEIRQFAQNLESAISNSMEVLRPVPANGNTGWLQAVAAEMSEYLAASVDANNALTLFSNQR